MANNKELSNTLTINNKTYNINAVKSDEAKKVTNYLKLYRKHYDGAEYLSSTDDYNGSEEKSINYVDAATGGEFAGPIKAGGHNLANGKEVSSEAVLNYNDLKHYLGTLTGIPWYFWRKKAGSTIPNLEDFELDNSQTNNTVNHMAIIIGSFNDLNSFVAYNNDNKLFPLFLYICDGGVLDGGGSAAGNIYMCVRHENRPGSVLVQLATNAFVIRDTDTPNYYDYDMLYNTFDSLGKLIKQNETNISKLGSRVTNNELNLSELWKLIGQIIDGDQTVEQAKHAQYDLDGNDIRRWYYRCASPYNFNNKAYSNTITINANIPTDNEGNNGDIWIKYEET